MKKMIIRDNGRVLKCASCYIYFYGNFRKSSTLIIKICVRITENLNKKVIRNKVTWSDCKMVDHDNKMVEQIRSVSALTLCTLWICPWNHNEPLQAFEKVISLGDNICRLGRKKVVAIDSSAKARHKRIPTNCSHSVFGSCSFEKWVFLSIVHFFIFISN